MTKHLKHVPALFLFSIAGALLAPACAGSGSGDTSCAPGTVDLDGKAENGCEYKCTKTSNAPDDPIDPDFIDDNCDGSDGVVASCVFVAPDGVDAPNAGS